MNRKATIGDVARAAGVSVSTVDRVLNGRGGVNRAKEAVVLATARRLNLDRNLVARPTRLLRVGVLMTATSNPFYRSLHAAFAQANHQYQTSSIQCSIQHIDVLRPEGAARRITAASASHDALVIVCPEEPVIAAAVTEAATAVPVITLASDLPQSGRLAYVGIDNTRAGRLAGELMGRFLGERGGEVAVMSGLRSYIGHEEREAGFHAVLAERFPACRPVAVVETREQEERAEGLVAELVRCHPAIAGIYNVSIGNRGIARALRRLDLGRHVVVITHELTPERRSLLKSGVLDALIDQNPELEVMTAVGLIAQHFGRQEAQGMGAIPLSVYLSENA